MAKRFIALGTAAFLGAAIPSVAQAGTGCNGVVNWFVWGCAGWDNNNGPQFPYFKKKIVTMKAPAGSRIERKDNAAVIDISGTKYPLAGGSVIAPGGANVIAPGGANVIAPGGANVQVIVQGG